MFNSLVDPVLKRSEWKLVVYVCTVQYEMRSLTLAIAIRPNTQIPHNVWYEGLIDP